MAGSGLERNEPPAPAVRFITPAWEDYAGRTPVLRLLWPVAWLAALVLLAAALSARGWHEPAAHGVEPGAHGVEPGALGVESGADAPGSHVPGSGAHRRDNDAGAGGGHEGPATGTHAPAGTR